MIQSSERSVGQILLYGFEGTHPSPAMLNAIQHDGIAGVSIFRAYNVESIAQIKECTDILQRTAREAGVDPLIIATDQESGQFLALGEEATQFAGNMALGATRDVQLAYAIGQAIGRELAAVGINVNYAPVCDVNTNPNNPSVGIRAYSDDPALVAKMAVAQIQGVQSVGIAATAKHFPGNGDSAVDSHYSIPVLHYARERLEGIELPPFQAAIDAGVRMMMTGHVGVPALTKQSELPATLSRKVMHKLLRKNMGFEGVIVTDALDMGAITQGTGQLIDVIAAVQAGIDLMLLTPDWEVQNRIYSGLQLALSRKLLTKSMLRESGERVNKLKRWLKQAPTPSFDIIACQEHQALAQQLAEHSVTLVRNGAGLLPLQLDSEAKIGVIMPRPRDLTPADTSSYIEPTLASAIRQHHPHVEEMILEHHLTAADISTISDYAQQFDLLIVGTISANIQPLHALLVNNLLRTNIPMITIALRTPYDLNTYPQVTTHICTYSILSKSMDAVANAMWGKIPFRGKLPVEIPHLYPLGHGLTL